MSLLGSIEAHIHRHGIGLVHHRHSVLLVPLIRISRWMSTSPNRQFHRCGFSNLSTNWNWLGGNPHLYHFATVLGHMEVHRLLALYSLLYLVAGYLSLVWHLYDVTYYSIIRYPVHIQPHNVAKGQEPGRFGPQKELMYTYMRAPGKRCERCISDEILQRIEYNSHVGCPFLHTIEWYILANRLVE